MATHNTPIKPLRILILGGTGFIGPHQVEYALARGHTVTLFNRGRTNPGLFPTVEKLIGDRNAPGGYKALEGRTWDVVIDNPVQVPRWVREAGAVLAPNVGKYVFVSTLSTYKNRAKIGISEADVDQLNPPAAPDATEKDASYGERKVRGEMDAKATFGERKALIVRPGLIVRCSRPAPPTIPWPSSTSATSRSSSSGCAKPTPPGPTTWWARSTASP
jgi:2'-hydroxyisoflavone reductase